MENRKMLQKSGRPDALMITENKDLPYAGQNRHLAERIQNGDLSAEFKSGMKSPYAIDVEIKLNRNSTFSFL